MKVRIIDLFIKIANGESVPKKIKYKGEIYKYDSYLKEYGQGPEEDMDNYLSNDFNIGLILNDEVEIVEEEPEKEKIKELPCLEYIRNDEFNKITYSKWSMPCNDTEYFLSLIINRVIKAIKDLTEDMGAMDKSMKEQAKHWNRRVQSLDSAINRLHKDIDDKNYTNHLRKNN